MKRYKDGLAAMAYLEGGGNIPAVLAVGGKDKYVRLWDPQRMHLKSEHRRTAGVTALCAAEGNVYNGCFDGTLVGLDVSTHKELHFQGQWTPASLPFWLLSRVLPEF